MAIKTTDAMIDQSRRGFLQALGIGIPTLSALLHEGFTAEAQDASPTAQTTLTEELSDPSLGHLTLDEVERVGHEVHYEEIANFYAGAMSLAPVISVRLHPEVTWIAPDDDVWRRRNAESARMAQRRTSLERRVSAHCDHSDTRRIAGL